MPASLPISVLIPIKDVRHRLEQHLFLNRKWLPLVESIVVVDSYSKDGSLEFLKSHLDHSHIRFLQHPPELYASWNYGIDQIRTPYTYISTIGENISLEGLVSLLEAIEYLDCDVVISPPEFTFETLKIKKKKKHRLWPIHTLLEELKVHAPKVIPPEILYPYLVYYLNKSILGSSASNLYKTESLQRYPFSSDYSRAGDSAWGLAYNYKVSIGLTPKKISTFSHHSTSHLSEQGNPSLAKMLIKSKLIKLVEHTIINSRHCLPAYGFGSRQHLQNILGLRKRLLNYNHRLEHPRLRNWYYRYKIKRTKKMLLGEVFSKC